MNPFSAGTFGGSPMVVGKVVSEGIKLILKIKNIYKCKLYELCYNWQDKKLNL